MVIGLGRFANLQYQVNDTCLAAAIRNKFNKIGAKTKVTLIPQLLRQPVPGLVEARGLVGLTTAWKPVGVLGQQAFQNGRQFRGRATNLNRTQQLSGPGFHRKDLDGAPFTQHPLRSNRCP